MLNAMCFDGQDSRKCTKRTGTYRYDRASLDSRAASLEIRIGIQHGEPLYFSEDVAADDVDFVGLARAAVRRFRDA